MKFATCTLRAPAGGIKDDWQGWIVLETTDLKARLSRDGKNPFFQLNLMDPGGWDKFYLDRIALKEVLQVTLILAAGSWECTSGSICYSTIGEVRDSIALLPLSRALLNKEWEHGKRSLFHSWMQTRGLEKIIYTYELQHLP